MEPRVPLNVLFVVPYAPTRIRTRPYHLIRALAAHGQRVTVATLWSDESERAAAEGLGRVPGVARVMAERQSTARSLWNCVRALPTRDPLQAHFSWSPALAQRLRRAVQDTAFDAIHVEHLRGVRYGLALSPAVAHAPGRPALVWDSVDCITSLFGRASKESAAGRVRTIARLELPRTAQYEGSVASRFDRVLVTSEVDRRELRALADAHGAADACIEVVPNGVDLEYFSPSAEPRDSATLVVTGKMSYHANATAVARFVRDVMPDVWSRRPEARLWIVGKDPGPEVRRLADARVVVTGTVDDIRPYLRRATLAVAPIQYGVGIQNKVLEALACGTPLVATLQAVSGLNAASREGLATASDAADLARVIIDLLGDTTRRDALGLAGRAFVEREHDWARIAARLADIYRHARN